MYVIRDIMQCQPGKVRDIVKKGKSLNDHASKIGLKPFRILTDVSGEAFWTVVFETDANGIDEFFASLEKVMANEEAGRIMAGYHDLVQNGRREIFKVEG